MRWFYKTLISFFCIWIGSLQAQEQTGCISLTDLEKRVTQGAQVSLAMQGIAYQQYAVARTHFKSGLKGFGNVGASRGVTILGPGQTQQFYAGTVTMGLEYPLLGSDGREKVAVLKERDKLAKNNADVTQTLTKSLLDLRLAYINYWGAEQIYELSKNFLATECEVEQKTKLRNNNGDLLASKRLELLADYDFAQNLMLFSELQKQKALDKIRLIVNCDPGDFQPIQPLLPLPDLTKMTGYLCANNPEIKLLQDKITNAKCRKKLSKWDNLESNVQLVQSFTKQTPAVNAGIPGNYTILQFNFRFPMDFHPYGSSEQALICYEINKLNLKLYLKKQQLMNEIQEKMLAYQVAQQNLCYFQQKLISAKAAMHESDLRHDALYGEHYEQVWQNKAELYRASFAAVRAQMRVLGAQAILLSFIPQRCCA